MNNIKFLFFALLILTACENGETGRESANDYSIESVAGIAEESVAGDMNAGARLMANPPAENELQLIKTAQLSIQVKDIDQASGDIQQLLEPYDAYISNDHLENYPHRKSRSIIIRVPNKNLEPLLDKLAKSGEYIAERSLNIRDVSEEYVDTEIRIRTKKAVHEQYLKLLERASKMEDILKIENEIRQIMEEIEAKEGRLRYLSDQVELSTIHLDLYQEIMVAETPPAKGFWFKASESIVNGWDLVKGLTLGLLSIWPIIILLVLIVAAFRYSRTRRPGAI